MRRLAELRPALVLFGHGPPLRDAERLARVAGRQERGYRARSTSGRV
jgi:glyoxylase-like metal-dependent hydrolase (beta-lactamase superfamily II)